MRWKVFKSEFVISESGLDSFGHLNNSMYFRYFEDARWNLLRPTNFSQKKIMERRKGPVLLEASVRFRRELSGGERVEIQTQIQSYEGKIAKLHQKMIALETGTLHAEADYTMGFFDLERRKLIEPTEEWLSALGRED